MLVWMRRVAHELLSRRAPMRRFIWLFVDGILHEINVAERLAAGNNAVWTAQRCDNVRVRFIRPSICVYVLTIPSLSHIYIQVRTVALCAAFEQRIASAFRQPIVRYLVSSALWDEAY